MRRDFTRVNELLAGVVPLYVVVDGGHPEALREPEALRALERLQQRLDATPGVSRTHSLLDTLRLLNRALERDDPAQERIPDTRAGVAELFFLLPIVSRSPLQEQRPFVRTHRVGSHRCLRPGPHRTRRTSASCTRPAQASTRGLTATRCCWSGGDSVARSQPQSIAPPERRSSWCAASVRSLRLA